MTKFTVEYNYWSISLQHHSQEGPNKAFFTNKDSIYSMHIHWNKRKRLDKKRFQFPQDLLKHQHGHHFIVLEHQ